MPSPEASFLDAIHDRPDDSGLRLIYADFLDEYGDPRSDLLRKEVLAAEILGRKNVHGILDAQSFYGQIEAEILEQLAKAPFPSKEILEECKDHLLVLSPGYSWVAIVNQYSRAKAMLDGQKYYQECQLHHGQCSLEQCKAQWLLLPRKPFADLFNLTFPEQQSRIAERYPEYRILRSNELASAQILHWYAAHRHRSNVNSIIPYSSPIRCADNHRENYMFHACALSTDGGNRYAWRPDEADSRLGIAVGRNF